jgi:hypothetical protein
MDKNIQHKPAHTGVFFDDQRRPVPVTPARAAQTPEDDLLDSLAEIGVVFFNRDKASDLISEAFDRHGCFFAAAYVAWLHSRLAGGGKEGALLRAVLLRAAGLESEESLAEQAAAYGISKQTWHRSIQRKHDRIFKNG